MIGSFYRADAMTMENHWTSSSSCLRLRSKISEDL